MPVEPCTTTVNGQSRPGRRWGATGKCYGCGPDGDCAEAERQAAAQGRAINARTNASAKDLHSYVHDAHLADGDD